MSKNPFPGMNPYIESQGLWRDFHATMLVAIRAYLNARLPDGFGAFIDARISIGYAESFLPDVAVTKRLSETLDEPKVSEMVVDKRDMPSVVSIVPKTERYLKIVQTQGDRTELITVIELLSPTNKSANGGQESYLSKQRQILESPVHLLEIDLLRGGNHTVAVPFEGVRNVSQDRWDSIVSLHRAESERYEFWTRTVREPLPSVCLPLSTGFEDVWLDLGACLNRTFDDSGYRVLDYRRPLMPPFDAETQAWVDYLLRERRLIQ